MVNGRRKVIIGNEAKMALKETYRFVSKDSLQNAEKIREGILKSIKELLQNPHKYPPDKYKKDKDVSYRAYEIFKYSITYYISDSEIRIIRIRHTKMNPLEY